MSSIFSPVHSCFSGAWSLRAWSFVALAVWSMSSPVRGAAAEAPIKVGHYASLTGKDASFGIVSRKGILLAVEEINAAGGLLGRPVEYLVEDIQSKAGESATAVK